MSRRSRVSASSRLRQLGRAYPDLPDSLQVRPDWEAESRNNGRSRGRSRGSGRGESSAAAPAAAWVSAQPVAAPAEATTTVSSTSTSTGTSSTLATADTGTIQAAAVTPTPVTITAGALTDIDETGGLQGDGATPTDPGATAQVDGGVDQADCSAALTGAGSSAADQAAYAALSTGAPPEGFTAYAVSGANDSNSAGQNAISVSGSNITNLRFGSTANGKLVPVFTGNTKDGSNNPLGVDSGINAINGGRIYLFRSSSDDNLLFGYSLDGTRQLGLYLQEVKSGTTLTGAKLWLATYGAIQHNNTSAKDETVQLINLFATVQSVVPLDLSTLASGQNVWNAFGDSEYQVIVMSDEAVSAGQTVNTSQGGGGTTIGNTNQLIEGRNPGKDKDGEAMCFTFASKSPGLLTADKRVFSSIAPTALLDANRVTWSISQTQGGGNGATASIRAYRTALETGQTFANDVDKGVNPADDAPITVTAVTIRDGSGAVVLSLARSSALSLSSNRLFGTTNLNVSITFNGDGSAELTGLREKDSITYETADLHNRVILQNSGIATTGKNVATTLDWDIGGFSIDDARLNSVALTVQVEDDAPTIASDVNVTVDDDDLKDGSNNTIGNSGGTGDDAPSNTSGTLVFDPGLDGLQSVVLLASGTPPDGFTYTLNAGVLEIRQGGTKVLTVTADSGTGDYTVTQNAAIQHALADNENNVVFTVGYRVTDKDGDSADGTLRISVDDDTPTAVSITVINGSVDEEGNGGNAGQVAPITGDLAGEGTSYSTGNLASLFNPGADRPLSFGFAVTTSSAIAAALGATGTASGTSSLSSGGTPLSYAVSGNTLTASAGTTPVFTLTINPGTGSYSFSLAGHLDHASGNGENDIVLSLGALIQATDYDGDVATGNADAFKMTVDDDSPTAVGSLAISGTVDEEGNGGNPGQQSPTTGDVDGHATVCDTGNLASLFNAGADVPLSFAFAATSHDAIAAAIGATGTASGTSALSSGDTSLSYSVTGDTLTAKAGTDTVFTLTINVGDGSYSFHMAGHLDHASAGGENDIVLSLGALIKATDDDGDERVGNAGSFQVTVDDDAPEVVEAGNAVATATSPNAYQGSGVYRYRIGSDNRGNSASTTNSDFVLPLLSGLAAGQAISNINLSRASETDSSAQFNFGFSYRPNPNSSGTASETGTLTFDKLNGTWSVNLTALDSYSEFLSTSNPNNRFVEYQVPTGGSGSPEVVTIELKTDFFVQFTGENEAGGSTPKLFTSGSDSAYTNGEIITAVDTSVLVSSVAQGVGGNTLQSPEVLDLNFFSTNPTNNTSHTDRQTASGVFLKFDGFGSEDMVVILKLVDGIGNRTTRALVVDAADVYTNKPGSTPPPEYPIALDNNDGAVIIERNDYCSSGENWLIEGAQILASTQKLSGSGIDFNRVTQAMEAATGVASASTGSKTFSKDSNSQIGTEDGDVFKIIEIGFVTESRVTPEVLLNFAVQVKDTDGDNSALRNLGVAITDAIQTGTAGADSLTGTKGADAFSGLGGTDTFVISDLKHSLLPAVDVITDYTAGESIDAPGSLSGTLTSSLGQASGLTATAIGALLTGTAFAANQAAAFTVAGTTGTFVALNDSTAGYQAASDALLFLQGYSIGAGSAVTVI